jgi:hypothetical protein
MSDSPQVPEQETYDVAIIGGGPRERRPRSARGPRLSKSPSEGVTTGSARSPPLPTRSR